MTWLMGKTVAARIERQRRAVLADLTDQWMPRNYVSGKNSRAYLDLLAEGVIEERRVGSAIECRRKR